MSAPVRSSVPGMDMPVLSELDLPARVSMFPQTLAWKLLLAAALLALAVLVLLKYRKYVRERWRRQARALAADAKEGARIGAWFELIKRVSLVHTARERLAALDDRGLLEQLAALDEPARKAMLDGHHRRQDKLPEGVNDAVARAFAQWLEGLPDAR